MLTKKTKIAPRWVTDGTIRFCGRVFEHPALKPLSGEAVQVAYDSFMDATIDIVDFNLRVIATLENRVVA